MQKQPVMWMVALGATALVSQPAGADDATVGDLQAQVNALKSRLAQFEASQSDAWLTEQRATEIRAIVQDVLLDADTRSSLLQGGGSAGWDKNFFMASADGNFLMKIKGQIQSRYVLNVQDDSPGLDTTRGGFEMRRVKLEFSGHVFDPTIKYKVKAAFDRGGGAFVLEDAYMEKDFDNGWSARVGQYKPPFMREELVSSSKQLLVDRSLVNEERNQDFAQGVQVAYEGEQFRVAGMFHDGFGSDNVAALTYDVEYAASGRAEILFAGNWKQFSDFTSWKGEDFAFMLGGGLHYQRMEFGTIAGPEEEEFMWTVDGSAEFGGANLYAAIVGRHLDVADVDRYGALLQGGFFVTDDIELFARIEWYDYDTAGVEDLLALTVGVNKYWQKHALKWTTDVGIGLNEVDPVFASSGAGWRGDGPGNDSQVVFRTQLQLLF